MLIYLPGLCLREKSRLPEQFNCHICMKRYIPSMETNIMLYIQYEIKIITTGNQTYPNRNLIIITKGSTLYGLASLSNIVAYSKQWPEDWKTLQVVQNSQQLQGGHATSRTVGESTRPLAEKPGLHTPFHIPTRSAGTARFSTPSLPLQSSIFLYV